MAEDMVPGDVLQLTDTLTPYSRMQPYRHYLAISRPYLGIGVHKSFYYAVMIEHGGSHDGSLNTSIFGGELDDTCKPPKVFLLCEFGMQSVSGFYHATRWMRRLNP